jgi:glycosyltransferase involved in cell wall biosynthesis
MTSLCLTMIVRNEGATIARCLRAAKPHITHWSIVDTGSTDNTREIIRKELAGVPGELHERPWRNFGHNRTESFQLAQSWLAKRCGVPMHRTWCLMLDADHELQSVGFDSAELSAAAYLVNQRAKGLRYANTRLIRADVTARCVSVTHEYWETPGREKLSTLTIIDHEDGGTRHEKFERDERLLVQGLIDEPGNERYMFYLAQTYQDMGQREKAIEWYRKRAEAGGFEEERWMARLRLGRILIAA